jgi:hypothetical protein
VVLCRANRGLRRIRIRDVERQYADCVAVTHYETIELRGFPCGRDETMTRLKHRMGESAADAARASRDKLALWHYISPRHAIGNGRRNSFRVKAQSA